MMKIKKSSVASNNRKNLNSSRVMETFPELEANYIKEKPIKSISAISNGDGLNFKYFELPEPIDSTEDLNKIEPAKIGKVEKLIFPYIDEDLPEFFGLKYNGIEVQKDDIYAFSVRSNDGSPLYVADQLVVDNDGPHGSQEKKGEIALQKGWHKTELSYFQAGGVKSLQVFINSDGREKTEIKADALHY